MKWFARRGVAITVGLVLGWMAQGWSAGVWPQANFAQASESSYEAHVDAAHGDEDKGRTAAELLVPGGSDAGWYRGVLWAIAGLFAAAVVVGVPISKLGGADDEEQPSGHDTAGAH